ncbi:MAG: alpha/beta hydrolase, partial [Bacteroidia bacterium]
MTVYLIPGLGFDCRIFSKFNFQNHEVVELNWLEPLANETWEAYATRMASKIEKDEKSVIIGHSLGGMLAQEISVHLNIKKLVLISTICKADENPWYFKILRRFGLYLLVAKQWINTTLPLW